MGNSVREPQGPNGDMEHQDILGGLGWHLMKQDPTDSRNARFFCSQPSPLKQAITVQPCSTDILIIIIYCSIYTDWSA